MKLNTEQSERKTETMKRNKKKTRKRNTGEVEKGETGNWKDNWRTKLNKKNLKQKEKEWKAWRKLTCWNRKLEREVNHETEQRIKVKKKDKRNEGK